MSHHKCGKRGTEHPPHRFRWYIMGGIQETACLGEDWRGHTHPLSVGPTGLRRYEDCPACRELDDPRNDLYIV